MRIPLIRFLRLALGVLFLMPAAMPAMAQSERVVEVVEVQGIIDERMAGFIESAIQRAAAAGDVEVVILQIDSRAVVAEPATYGELHALLSNPPLPVVAWVGDAPAVASGGVLELVRVAPLSAAAPGIQAGLWNDGTDFPQTRGPKIPGGIEAAGMVDGLVEVTEPIPGLFDLVAPETASPRQLAQVLDGMEVGSRRLQTVRPFVDEDGNSGVTVLTTVIRQPGYWTRLLALASRPEALFFFLAMGLTIAVFEFYAIGPGIAAGVAVACLGLAAAGLTVLPVRGWAMVLASVAIWLLAASYQRGGAVVLTGFGLILLAASGFAITDGAPLIRPAVPGVLLGLASVAFFFLLAMPVVARSRFSTQTIGRDSLIGRNGIAMVDFGPNGEVELDGARWRATAHRESGIKQGDSVVVLGIDGLFLEVDSKDREK